MTWNEALRLGCEVGGLVRLVSGRNPYYAHSDGPYEDYCWHQDNPALPAYVASLLAKRVGVTAGAGHMEKVLLDWGYNPSVAYPRARILAALVAPGKMTIEDAKEAAS